MTSPTELTRRLGIAHQIIQGPFGGGLSTTTLASTVSNLGGLGSFGAYTFSPDEITRIASEIRALTPQPFALNLWVSNHDEGGSTLSQTELDRIYALVEPYFTELGVEKPPLPARFHQDFDAQIDALLEARPSVFSFVFGIPSQKILAECRRREITTVGAATSIAEARALDDAGVDAIVVSGCEAGGHRPSFLARAEDSLIGTGALVPAVADRVKAPIIAAGGIADQRGVRAMLALGASAAQLGTSFLACDESGTSKEHRALLYTDRAEQTTLTRSFTGRLARGMRNRWTDEIAPKLGALAPFPIQQWIVGKLRPAAVAAGRTDLVALWSGQAAPALRHHTASALMQSLVQD